MSDTLTKRDICIRLMAETGLEYHEIVEIVDKLFDYITENAAAGGTTELRNFGVFKVALRKPRIGRNPNAPEIDLVIPARAVVKFIPGKELRAQVLKLTPVELLPEP